MASARLLAHNNPLKYIDPMGTTARSTQSTTNSSSWLQSSVTPLFHTTVNPQTDILSTIGTYDSGNAVLNYANALGASVYNFGATTVNAISNGLSLPLQGYAAATNQTLQQAESQLTATAASTGPLALPLLTGTKVLSAPVSLSRGARNVSNTLNQFLSPSNSSIEVGAGRRNGQSIFNPTGSKDNCVNGVCAFLNTIDTGQFHTASPNVAHNGGSIPVALQQIAGQTGARIGTSTFSRQFSSLDTTKDRQFFVVFDGPDFDTSGHVAVGISNNGNKTIFDPQTGTTYKNPADFSSSDSGSFTAFPILLPSQQ